MCAGCYEKISRIQTLIFNSRRIAKKWRNIKIIFFFSFFRSTLCDKSIICHFFNTARHQLPAWAWMQSQYTTTHFIYTSSNYYFYSVRWHLEKLSFRECFSKESFELFVAQGIREKEPNDRKIIFFPCLCFSSIKWVTSYVLKFSNNFSRTHCLSKTYFKFSVPSSLSLFL